MKVATFPVRIEGDEVFVEIAADARTAEVETVVRSLIPHLIGRRILQPSFDQNS